LHSRRLRSLALEEIRNYRRDDRGGRDPWAGCKATRAQAEYFTCRLVMIQERFGGSLDPYESARAAPTKAVPALSNAKYAGPAGLETIRNRHTCAHRVDELLHLYETIRLTVVPEEIHA
jgi:hypothetical protein